MSWYKPAPVFAAIFLALFSVQGEESRPNILWFVVDDMSANFSCYGEKLIQTPAAYFPHPDIGASRGSFGCRCEPTGHTITAAVGAKSRFIYPTESNPSPRSFNGPDITPVSAAVSAG